MYRLVLYSLFALAAIALVLSFVGILSFGPIPLVLSFCILIAACWVSNSLIARIFNITVNVESAYITALILFFIVAPVENIQEMLILALVGVIAMASKYMLAIRKKHIFNPAAISLVIMGLLGSGIAFWWVATPWLFPFTVIIGLLIVRKIRRFDLFLSFLAFALVIGGVYAVIQDENIGEKFMQMFLSWPLVFLGTVMLTEPLTMSSSRKTRIIYGAIVGGLFSAQFHIGPLFASPELALVIGNVFAYIVSSKQKLLLKFTGKRQLSENVYEFIFKPNQKLAFTSGQYLEWTVRSDRTDSRGNRRFFTVASAPGDDDIRLGVRISKDSSTFKQRLMTLVEGETAVASSLSGDFMMPRNKEKPLIFIAGGIGITPFISMIRHMLKSGEKRNIKMLYAANSVNDFAYKDLLEEAKIKIGVETRYIAAEKITEEMIKDAIGNDKPTFYISGPDVMVRAYKKLLRNIGIIRTNIRTDYFPGF